MRWLFSTPVKIDGPRIAEAIDRAESGTSGQIRVLLARHRTADPVAAAQRHFERLEMTRTRHRNGVLIFLAPRSRNFAIIGDEGVHQACGDEFWQELTKAMAGEFRRGEFTAGLLHGIERAGALLAVHFPRPPDDRNELPDKVEEVD